TLAVGWFAFGWITVRLLATLGFSRPSQQLVAYALGSVLLAIGIESAWRRPGGQEEGGSGNERHWLGRRANTWLWSLYFLLLWLSWVVGALRLFWLAAVAAGLPLAAVLAQRAVNNILRPPGTEHSGEEIPSVLAAIIERGLRVLLIVGAIA